MKINSTILAYWQSKQPVPSWAKGLERKGGLVCHIDHIINVNGEWRPSGANATHNTVELLKLVRRNIQNGIRERQETLQKYLSHHTCITPKRREQLFKKWHKRLLEDSQNYKGSGI